MERWLIDLAVKRVVPLVLAGLVGALVAAGLLDPSVGECLEQVVR